MPIREKKGSAIKPTFFKPENRDLSLDILESVDLIAKKAQY